MAFTSADLEALDAAIRTGTRRVSYGTRTVDYHSLDEMMRLRQIMAADVATTGERTSYGSVRIYPDVQKGA